MPFTDSSSLNRRAFVAGSAATVATALSRRSIAGANERIGVGIIGYGLIGKRHVLDFQEQPDVRIVAVAEAHRGRLDEAKQQIGGGVRGYADFRKLLEDREVDAVVISTPDHWHALMTILACAAGKDVYVEKPLTVFQREGRWMIDAAKKYNRVVQVGTQQRSGSHYQKSRELIAAGKIGKLLSVRMQTFRNIMPGFGAPADSPPPPELDWDAFVGPAPLRPYNRNRGIYHFRWFWDYSGGQMTNLGAHSLDIVDWFLGGVSPSLVMSVGGRFALRDNGETPDTQDAIFQYPGWTATWSHREASRGSSSGNGLEFFGTKGSLVVLRGGFTLTPDRKITPENAIPRFTGAHPVGGPVAVAESGPPQFWTETLEDKTGDDRQQFKLHVRNFLDCIKSRGQPVSDLDSAHRTATTCHLANISLRLGRQVRWDAAREAILDDTEAAQMLVRSYRSPWDAERKAALS